MNASELIDECRKWLGVKWQHQGRTRNGIDCVGLPIVVANDLGISDFDINQYSRVPSGHMMQRLLSTVCTKITDIRKGDILHMAFIEQPQHIAIVSGIDPLQIIHADTVAGKVVEHRLDDEWISKIRGAYRIPGVFQ